MEKQLNIDSTAFIAEGVKIIGEVCIGENSSVWYNSVIRSDYEETSVVIGKNTNIQDGSVVHLDAVNSTFIGDEVTIGHKCIIHGCTVEDGALIGMGAVILNGAVVGKNAIIAAGSVVKEGCIVEPNTLYAGIPAKKMKDLSEKQAESGRRIAEDYSKMAQKHKTENFETY
ncbi:MAG: gamma carbonic anhydrase family protein [Victivallales bacterium]|nr:gamma carbonic anhydrase family protein [Victivallales bacterium]